MRLLTRSDFDGLACGTLLKHLGVVDNWKFVHPKDVQDGTVQVTADDVLANVPYAEGCGLWFDHHSSEIEHGVKLPREKGAAYIAASCARVIFDYYNGVDTMFEYAEMVQAVDKVDSARLSIYDIKEPRGWILLGFIMDPRTGLGRFREFKISNYQLMEKLIDICGTMEIEDILKLEDVAERIDLYNEQNALFIEMLNRLSHTEDNVIVTDVRGEDVIYSGNRFLIYSLFPKNNVNVWISWGKEKQNVAVAVGHSILRRTCKTDVGQLMHSYGGGGHKQVGTCQVPVEAADEKIKEILAALRKNG
ncbi:MAG: exopolyphosphatase [Defluviitaleaceae bacterium]|nr:exopolyphosphatase [Defluviitaleaceae bacterium]